MDPSVDIYVYIQTYSYISRVCGITFLFISMGATIVAISVPDDGGKR